MEYKETISIIKAKRLSLGLSLQQVGDKIGKSKQFVSQVEKAAGANYNTIQSICNALDLVIEVGDKINTQ